jgi:hypothetical protein
MIYRRECDLRSDLLAEIFEHCTTEILYIVDHDVSGHTVVVDDILPKEFSD